MKFPNPTDRSHELIDWGFDEGHEHDPNPTTCGYYKDLREAIDKELPFATGTSSANPSSDPLSFSLSACKPGIPPPTHLGSISAHRLRTYVHHKIQHSTDMIEHLRSVPMPNAEGTFTLSAANCRGTCPVACLFNIL